MTRSKPNEGPPASDEPTGRFRKIAGADGKVAGYVDPEVLAAMGVDIISGLSKIEISAAPSPGAVRLQRPTTPKLKDENKPEPDPGP